MKGMILPWLLLLLFPLFAMGQERAPARQPRLPRSLEYARIGGRPLLLDLYTPAATATPVPLILYIHGGDWMFGNRGRPPVLFLVKQGFAVASIDYRLAPNARFPAQIQDCRDALLFVRSNARHYGIDPDHIGVMGESAGGHLAALLGTAPDVKEFVGTRRTPADAQVQAICSVSGPMDIEYLGAMADMVEDAIGKHPIQQLLGGRIEQHRALSRLASPIRHISKDTPPFLLIFGDQDFVVPPILNRDMAKALADAGVSVEAHEIKGMGHDLRQVLDGDVPQMIAAFFQQQLVTGPSTRPAAEKAAEPAPRSPETH